MKFLQFKAENGETITFDEYVDDRKEYGGYWVTICPKCKQAFGHLLGSRIDDYGSGCCSVLGCTQEDDDEVPMYYVDFSADEVEEIE